MNRMFKDEVKGFIKTNGWLSFIWFLFMCIVLFPVHLIIGIIFCITKSISFYTKSVSVLVNIWFPFISRRIRNTAMERMELDTKDLDPVDKALYSKVLLNELIFGHEFVEKWIKI